MALVGGWSGGRSLAGLKKKMKNDMTELSHTCIRLASGLGGVLRTVVSSGYLRDCDPVDVGTYYKPASGLQVR